MNIPSKISLPLAAIFVASAAHAQTIEFISVSKSVSNQQTDATTVILDPEPVSEDYGGPFGFELSVQGTDISGMAAPTVSSSEFGALDATYFNGGVLVYNGSDESWALGYPYGNSYGATSQAEIDSLFGNGVYNLNVTGTALSIDLSPEDFPNQPRFTLSGGEWVEGAYQIPYDADLVITTNVFTDYGTHEEDAIWMDVWSENGDYESDELLVFASQAPTSNSVSMTIPAGSFTAGHYYELEAGFFGAVDFQTNAAFPDAKIAGGFEQSTYVRLVATPLPDPEPVTTQIEGAVMIKFDSVNGATYRIEGSYDMENWFEAEPNVTGFGGEMRFFFERVSPQQFYRVTKLN